MCVTSLVLVKGKTLIMSGLCLERGKIEDFKREVMTKYMSMMQLLFLCSMV